MFKTLKIAVMRSWSEGYLGMVSTIVIVALLLMALITPFEEERVEIDLRVPYNCGTIGGMTFICSRLP